MVLLLALLLASTVGASPAGAAPSSAAPNSAPSGSAPSGSAARGEEAANRHRLARVTLVGPLEQALFRVEPMGETIVHAGLLEGERRSLVVPLPVWGAIEDLVPEVEVRGSGRASFAGWTADNAAADRAWAALPRSLRQRPRPAPAQRGPARLPVAALLVAAAALAAGWSQRARAGRSLLLSLAGAGCVVALVAPEPPAPGVRVLEGDGASGAWVVVDAARGQIDAPAGAAPGPLPWRVECQPPRMRLVYELWLTESVEVPWSLRGSRLGPLCTLFVCSPLALAVEAVGQLGPESNRLVALSEAWVRAADGSGWEALGAWPLGAALPTGGHPQDPPGGLNPALPLGQRVLVGRLAAEGLEDPVGGGRARATWLRLVGF